MRESEYRFTLLHPDAAQSWGRRGLSVCGGMCVRGGMCVCVCGGVGVCGGMGMCVW